MMRTKKLLSILSAIQWKRRSEGTILRRAGGLMLALLFSLDFYGVGWTPTDAGLVLNFEPGDQFLLSVMIDGTEYFVCDYPSYPSQPGDRFNYPTGNYLKLLPQPAGEISDASIWRVDTALSRIKNGVNYALGGISYTMRSLNNQTLITQSKSVFKFLGDLAVSETKGDAACLCDVVFVVPTVRATTNMDPSGTLEASHTAEGRHRGEGTQEWAFDGKMGYNSDLQLYYREVYWFDIPRTNDPNTYTNAALVTFNTTNSNKSWSAGTIQPGMAAYAFADGKHNPTTRTLFRIYPLNKPFSSCGSYFFGWDVQNYVRYRQSNTMGDSTAARKIYTLDHFVCMKHETEPDSSFFRTEGMQVPPSDSTYFYVGHDNAYHTTGDMGKYGAKSQFKPIDSLRVRGLREETTVYKPSKNAFGYMAIDTLSKKDNLGVAFEPAGYFLRTNTGTNVRLVPDADRTLWTCDEMWTITEDWSKLKIKATLFTGPEFSETDPGADIKDWSELVVGSSIKVKGSGESCTGKSGWAQIDVTNPAKNGGMVFIEADSTLYIRYDYNGHFGTPIPDQHPAKGDSLVKVQAPRLLGDYKFNGWNTAADGSGTPYAVGADVDFRYVTEVDGKRVLVLYAQAQYKGSINVAISFLKEDGKRYFLTHPNTDAPRFARTRTFTDWTNVYQGMFGAGNTEPNYMSSYKIIGKEGGCDECEPSEYVLDPRHETMYGAVDSLVFYEYWTPNEEEYIGLYYTSPNTILANHTWAGLFTSTGGWPTPANPCIENTHLYSAYYLERDGSGDIQRYKRTETIKDPETAALDSLIEYKPATDQFDGVAAGGTDFMISGVGVVDEHYVILPDTTDATTPWTNEITFDYHEGESTMQQVWSKLIGKQLLAQMKVGDDTIYFHPNRNKILNTASAIRTSRDFRLRHEFQYIHDTRAAGLIAEGDSAYMEETGNDFCCNIHSGMSSPIGPTHDIVDTLRVWLRPIGASKIKAYYGRWNDASVDSILPDGSRYRDILIKTRTYHYGDTQTDVVLQPEMEAYNFGALEGISQTLRFHVIQEQYRILYDSEGHEIRKEVLGQDTIPDVLDLSSAPATLKEESRIFTIDEKTETGITLTTKADNKDRTLSDTLTVSTSVTISETAYTITAKVPLQQASLQGEELIWAVKYNNLYYFITIEADTLRFRPFDLNNGRWQRNKQELKKGSANAGNTDHQYMTPWKFTYSTGANNQLALKTEYGVNKYFNVNGTKAGAHATDSTLITYEYVHVYTNDNANIEEQIKLKYGANQWFQVTGAPKSPALTFTTNKEEATVFIWGYLSQEYELLNNGDYPSADELVYIHNSSDAKNVQTRYKAYREYSMLVNDQLTYLCREDSTDLSVLNKPEGNWKMGYSITRKADARTFDKEEGDPDVVSGLGAPITDGATLITTIAPSVGTSPTDVTIDGQYVNIVDTLLVTLSPQEGAPAYRFKDWAGVSSFEDAALKIPLVRKTYHDVPYNSVTCAVENDEYNYAFPPTLPSGDGTETADSCHMFRLHTYNYIGTRTLDVDNNIVAEVAEKTDDLTKRMDLDNHALSEIRLEDENGKTPEWCKIENIGDSTLTIKCTKNGIRSPRSANIYFAYIVTDESSNIRYVNYKLTISQASLFQYANNQTLLHSRGYTGDEKKKNGMQQTHENKRILYYYNPAPYDEADQDVELPIRERDFYGWWRWYREGVDEHDVDVSDMDIPDSLWIDRPRNVGRYNYPFRIIGDSVKVPNPNYGEEGEPDSIKQLVTMGRYTVFHYPSVDYQNKANPPANSPKIMAPQDKKTLTYVVDLSNYYDNLPLSMTHINQVDTAVLDTMRQIIEPTLSLREIFELRPWTEMAERMEHYKDTIASETRNLKYMEDHVVMAPIGHRLLLSTEQRYNYDNLTKTGHSESLLGYYMRDDNWGTWAGDKDTMIWCGGWDAICMWFIYDPKTKTYSTCPYEVTESDDFLSVPAKGSITGGSADTVYLCMRSRSMKSTPGVGIPDLTVPGDYWFNICRYKIIYHDTNKYGPKQEETKKGITKAIITNDEIEQDYEVLERLNFDYFQPGEDYHVYPHPLPWGDASYGYSYPMGPEIPDNRYHNDFAPNFPGPGEYSIINRIPYSNHWHKMGQHGGAANGYMIYCDGMSSSGQVAALSLSTHLCEGQKMYFSGYVGNPSNNNSKAKPNFTFSVQGWDDKAKQWEDITTYMTGDIAASNKWSQIFFPIEHEKAFEDFRVRIYNMSSDWDGNDFIIDDMCIFATKPPVIAYQANTRCVEQNETDSIIHVVLRVDYQGFTDISYNNTDVNYTIEQTIKETNDTCFVPMIDGYIGEEIQEGAGGKPDTIYGTIHMPAHDYTPTDPDSIFLNFNQLADTFETSFEEWEKDKSKPMFRQGYIFENLDGDIRPVLYIVHKAKMTADKQYTVRMSLGYEGLMNSLCAMMSDLKVTNRMMLMLNGEEQDRKEVEGICGNTIFEVSLRVRGTLIEDGSAPQDQTGSCMNDWLMYGDTAAVSSKKRYGYKYSDIVKVVKDILRYEPAPGESNVNQFASSLEAVNPNVMKYIQESKKISLDTTALPYTILSDLVNNGFLTLYKSNIMTNVQVGDSVQYVVFPIVGTGTDDMQKQNMEVCPTPIVIKLKAKTTGGGVPLIIGGLNRDSTQLHLPIVVLADAENANNELVVPVDSIRTLIGIHSVTLISTDDPNYREGVHKLALTPDKVWPRDGDSYYMKGDNITFRPASSNNYEMQPGYNYTFTIEMVSATDDPSDDQGCPIGNVPMTVSIVPDILRWAPMESGDNRWNNPMNWLGVTANNDTLHANARFAPLARTDVIIPAMPAGMPYPVLPDPSRIASKDSIQAVGFTYNTCDDIRFLPGGAVNQQQRLSYDVVVTNMMMPYNKWALRSAPITGMISGDIFMADADLSGETKLWSVGTFDANGRNYRTGNATFWLSLYSREITQMGNGDQVGDSTRTATADWTKLANGMTEALAPAQGWAVYARTASGQAADVRLPKSDDTYYYYYNNGDQSDRKETDLVALRSSLADGEAGKLAYHPDSVGTPRYALVNGAASTSFVFGNPTMGYIDIWGFIDDNCLKEEFDYINGEGRYTTVTRESIGETENKIGTLERYLPPMHAIVVKLAEGQEASTRLNAMLQTNRIVTEVSQVVPSERSCPGGKASQMGARALGYRNVSEAQHPKGIMTVTAINPVSSVCTSRLLLGEGYHNAVIEGEDAILTTININNYSSTTPSTPFNIYAVENGSGLSIDLRASIVNVPISFSMSDLPFEPVTHLWFTGVNNISEPLVLYDALLDTQRRIVDGICLSIETPEMSHLTRYYIRHADYTDELGNQTPTSIDATESQEEQAVKIIYHGNVYILRNGHVFTIYGQKVR